MATNQEDYIEYLNSRIQALTNAYTAYKLAEEGSTKEIMKMAYNSLASGLHETKDEIVRAKETYMRLFSIQTEIK